MSVSTTNGNTINKFAELLKQSGNTVIDYKCTNLIGPGENYGSLMLAVEVLAKNKNGNDETIQLVAKLLPQNEWIQKMFNIPVTFKKEVYFYRDLLPTLCAFQRERGMTETMEFFPKYYGSRLSLNSESNSVDSDAALLLENLKFAGCETIERTVGFNGPEIRLILADLAVFHAVPIAFKKCYPEVFLEKCMPHLEKPVVFTDMSEDVYTQSFVQLVKNLERTEEVLPFLERMKTVYQLCSDNMINHINPFREPYATIIHNDYWVNNTMIKMSGDKKTPVGNFMVDFQLIEYGNPACDLIFLLFTSVRQEVLKRDYNELVSLYHEKFVETLVKLKCDASAFSEMALREELRLAARETQFCHCLVMCRPIHADRAFVKELSDMTEEDMLTEDGLTAGYFKKIAEVVLNFVERDWI